MRTIRCHVDQPLAAGATVSLPGEAGQHLLRVLRLSVGDEVRLFNGDGHDYPGRLSRAGKQGAEVELAGRIAVDGESPLRITLVQGIARGEKMDLVLQKATELGVAAIVPVVTERTEVKLDAERGARRMAHWRGVITSACAQSGRATVPSLSEPLPLSHYAGGETAAHRLVLDPRNGRRPRELALPADATVALAVGPEGGLSERDLETLRAAGFSGLRLGPRVLRTETAGLAAVAALLALYGDL